ncbi:E3 ubiquitin-protein ligase TTC3-like [Ptychodera flava]|uniref:E3 ubiquitin-protein ligase TTC3-like n=1 Tax=Ptychodera flava TaxID=63121 RepID=UPI00396A4C4E
MTITHSIQVMITSMTWNSSLSLSRIKIAMILISRNYGDGEPCMLREKSQIKMMTFEKKKRQPQEFTKVPSNGFDEKEATEEDWHLKVQEHFKEASEELLQDRPRFAVKSFRQAFYIMDTQLKNYEYEELDIVVSIYAYGVACLETAQVQELEIALEKFDCIILEHETIVFPLAYYGKGRVYIKQNRFSEALDPLRNGLLILQRQVHQHGVVRWPGTKHIIEESDTKKMKEAFEINIEICKSPPQPDAVCRLHDPSSNTKIDIYFSDPDFKGFVRTQCHEHCTLEFHPSCWKKIKHENVEKAQDKDYLGERCFTPDCDAVIVYIVIFSQDGLKRTEFTGEKPERKPKNAAAKAVKVKAYSEKKLEKLRRKKEIKMEKKRLAKENCNKQNNDDNDDDANILESELLLGASNANRPTSLPLSSVSNNVINSSSNSPGTPDSPNQLTPFEIGYVLKKEEIQDDQALGAHAKPVKTKSKKKKQKNVQTLDLFLGKKPGDVDLEDEDGSRQRSFNMLDENSPFAVPEQLLTEAAMFERRRINPVIAPPPMTEEERKAEEQLRDSLFSYFAQILEKHGPLQVEDPVLVSGFYEIFPPEAHKLVTRWGNLSNFLLQSLQFAMVDDMVCLLKDSVRCRELVRQKTGTPNPDGKSNLKPLNGKAPSASVENTQGAAFINQSANLSSENFPNLSAVHAANKGSNGKRTSRSNNSNHSTSNQSMNSAINPKIDVKTSNFPTLDKLSDIVFDGRKGNSKEAISELSSFEAIGNSFRESKGHADTMPELALTKGSNGSVPYQNVSAAELPMGNISLQQRASNHLTMSTSHLKYNASEDMNRLDRCDSGIHEETPNPAEDKIPNFSLSVASHRAENNSIPEECSEWTGGVSDISDLHLSMLTSGDSFRHSYPQTGKRSKRDFSVQVVFNPYVKSIAVNTDGTALYKQKQFDKLSRENHYLQMQLQDKLDQLERSKNKCQVLQKTLADSKDMEKVLQATNREILLQHDSETRKRDKEIKEKSDLIEKLQQQEKTAREQKEKVSTKLTEKTEEIQNIRGMLKTERSNWMSERVKFDELKATIEDSYKKATQRAKDAEIMVLELQLKADCEPYEVKQKESEYYHSISIPWQRVRRRIYIYACALNEFIGMIQLHLPDDILVHTLSLLLLG